jgi:hypothetical protein
VIVSPALARSIAAWRSPPAGTVITDALRTLPGTSTHTDSATSAAVQRRDTWRLSDTAYSRCKSDQSRTNQNHNRFIADPGVRYTDCDGGGDR